MKRLDAKRWTATLGILFLLVISMCLVSCLSWIMEEPSFVLRQIILRPTSLSEGNLVIGLDVQNPNRFDLTLKSFEYVLFLDDKEIGSGHLEKEILIPSLSTTQVQVSVAAKFKDLGGSLKKIVAGHDLPYKIEGTASIGTTFGSRNFSLSKDRRTN